jgi:hypothetical protein
VSDDEYNRTPNDDYDYTSISNNEDYSPAEQDPFNGIDLEALKMERDVHPHESNAEFARRLLNEAAPKAAISIIHIALHGLNENTRFNAAKYISDITLNDDTSAAKEGWEALVGDVISKAEILANQ